MNKSQPKEDFKLSSIDEKFIFKAKTSMLYDYFKLSFLQRMNYDFSEYPILNFIDRSKFYLIYEEEYFRTTNPENGFVSREPTKTKKVINFIYSLFSKNEDKEYRNENKKLNTPMICHLIKNNIMENFIKHKMYKNITYNFMSFDKDQLFKIYYSAPDEDLIEFIDKLKNNILSNTSDYKLLLNSLVLYCISKRPQICKSVLENLPNIMVSEADIIDIWTALESKNMFDYFEYFKENNYKIYNNLILNHSKKQISNF